MRSASSLAWRNARAMERTVEQGQRCLHQQRQRHGQGNHECHAGRARVQLRAGLLHVLARLIGQLGQHPVG